MLSSKVNSLGSSRASTYRAKVSFIRIRPKDDAILLHYTNSYEGHFGLMLRDKFPNDLEATQDWASKIEENMLSSKVDSLGSSRASTSRVEVSHIRIRDKFPNDLEAT
jgi:hypothetical protein